MAAETPRQDLKRQVERLERRLAETREELAAIKDQQAAVAPGVIEALGLETPTGRRQALKYAGGAATLPALVAYAASEQAQADAVAADVGTQADPWQKVWTHELESGDGATQLQITDTVVADADNTRDLGASGTQWSTVFANTVATGQSWGFVTGSRSFDTWFTAPSDEDIWFVVTTDVNANGTIVTQTIDINGTQSTNGVAVGVDDTFDSGDAVSVGPFKVPAGNHYQIRAGGNTADYSINRWAELST